MASPKWFDLSEHNAKIERVGLGRGVFHLRLELPSERLESFEDKDLLDAGWVETDLLPNGRRLLENHRTMNDTRSMAEALLPFFSREELVAARAGQDMMKQGEQMDGLQERVLIEEAALADQVDMVSSEDRLRIMNSVMAAAGAQRAKNEAERSYPLDSRGTELFNDIVDHFEAGLARGREGLHPNAIKDAAASYGNQFLMMFSHGEDPTGSHIYDAATSYLKAKDSGDQAEQSAAMGRISFALTDGKEPKIGFSAKPQQLGMGNQSARDLALRDAVYGGVVPIATFGGRDVRLSSRVTVESIMRDLPFKVVRDNSMPTRDLANYASAVTRATEFVAEQLGLDRDELVPNQTSIPLRFNNGFTLAGKGATGVVKSIGNSRAGTVDDNGQVQRGALTIAVSLQRPGSFVHELGHVVDFGNGLSKDAREAILSRSGALGNIITEIRNGEGLYGPEYAKYLSSHTEIFARMFESAMIHQALRKGDRDLASLGGFYAVHAADHFAARDDMTATEGFLEALTEEMRAIRSRSYEKVASLDRAAGEREVSMASAQQHFDVGDNPRFSMAPGR